MEVKVLVFDVPHLYLKSYLQLTTELDVAVSGVLKAAALFH